MSKQPLLLLCICFILGIFFQDHFLLRLNSIYLLLIFSFISLLIYFLKSYYIQRFRQVLLFLFIFLCGVFWHFKNTQKPILPTLGYKENIVFKITKKLNSNAKNRRYEIIGWKNDKAFNSILSVPKSEKEFDFLHFYKADLNFQKVESPYSDFQFDYSKYLARKNIYYQAFLPDSYVMGLRKEIDFAEKIKQKRLETLGKIDHSFLSKKTRELMKGIILADRTEMDKETVQDFTKSGLVHILAISGSHMAIIFWLILIILNPIFPPKLRNFKLIISLILIWAFAIFIDYGNSVVRSCMMISAYYIYVLLQRKPDLLHSMAIAASVILINNTNQLFDVGFQLSFMAVFGIFWLNEPILKYLPKPKNNFQNFLVNIVSISLSAQIATLPLVIFYFHQYSFISILANFIVIPFVEILIIFSLLMTVLISFSLQFGILNLIYDYFVSVVLKIIHVFAEVDLVFFKNIPITLMEVIAAFIIVYFLRFLIVKFNVKNGLRVIYFVLIFAALRFSLNYKADHIEEVLVHQYYNQSILSVKNGKEITFVMKENLPLEKIENYIINPYLTSRRMSTYKISLIPKNVHTVKIGEVFYRLD